VPLTLLVPDLLPPVDAPAALAEVRLPGIEKGLGRADIAREAADGVYGWLATDWGLAAPVPFAAIALAGDDRPREGTWMRADPVHLRIERDLVALHDASVLDVGRDEADRLVAALQALFRDDGLEFHAPAPERWYVRVPDTDVPRTTPLHSAVGRDIFTLLPRGAGPLNWRSMITESQMVLSSHAANARREAAGLPAVNSVWFWGEGALPASVAPRYAQVYANDAFTRGLATLSGVTAQAVPERFDGLAAPSATGETLVVVDDLTRALRRADIDAWLTIAKSLDTRWFAPAAKAKTPFGTVRLVLTGESGAVVATLTSRAKWRFLNRPRRLADYA
jgi:hypothetical protein